MCEVTHGTTAPCCEERPPAPGLLRARGRPPRPTTRDQLGRGKDALLLRRDVYSGRLKLLGEEHHNTLLAANNYAASFFNLRRFEEAKSLLRKTIPVAQRILGEGHRLALRMRTIYAVALSCNDGATLDDLREAVTTLEEIERTGRRVLGGAHPLVGTIVGGLQHARAELAAREGDDD